MQHNYKPCQMKYGQAIHAISVRTKKHSLEYSSAIECVVQYAIEGLTVETTYQTEAGTVKCKVHSFKTELQFECSEYIFVSEWVIVASIQITILHLQWKGIKLWKRHIRVLNSLIQFTCLFLTFNTLGWTKYRLCYKSCFILTWSRNIVLFFNAFKMKV